MNALCVFFSSLVLCSLFLGITLSESRDVETKDHIKNQHNRLHHHSRHSHHAHESFKRHVQHSRHQKKFKTRDANSSTCINVFELELIALAKWFNNTEELKLIFAIIPPSVKQLISGNITTRFSNSSDSTISPSIPGINTNVSDNNNSTSNSSSISWLNGAASLDLNLFYNATGEWPILTYFARLAGHFLSRAHGLPELFRNLPVFRDIWRIIIRGLLNGAEQTGTLIENIRDLFGFNGNVSGNLFNFTYWNQLWSPSGIVHAVEGDIETLGNLTKIFG